MKLIIKLSALFLMLIVTNTSLSQINMESFVGKSYGKLYKEVALDSNFISCRLLTSTPNKISGVELYFKDDVHYVVSFRKGRVNDSYDCYSFAIRAAKVYVIHSFKERVYQTGYCRCTVDEQAKLIKPTIQKNEP